MRKVIGVITARMRSTRLPGKVLAKVSGKSIFALVYERMRQVEGLSGVYLATSVDPLNKALIKEAKALGCGWYAGAEQDIVERHIELCERGKADAVIRVTCDCPLFDMASTSRFVNAFKKDYFDFIYISNASMIQGIFSELISYEALREVHKHYRGAAISIYIRENLDKFKTLGLKIETDLTRPEYRLTVDESQDLKLIRAIYAALYKGKPLDLHAVYAWLDDNPEVAELNRQVGIKGCNVRVAGLMERPVYSIVNSTNKYVILDAQKRVVKPQDFLAKLKVLFPSLKITPKRRS